MESKKSWWSTSQTLFGTTTKHMVQIPDMSVTVSNNRPVRVAAILNKKNVVGIPKTKEFTAIAINGEIGHPIELRQVKIFIPGMGWISGQGIDEIVSGSNEGATVYSIFSNQGVLGPGRTLLVEEL